MRCASWRSSVRPSSSRSSGWPIRMICSSFCVSVSRLVSRRTCSSTSGARFCASSTTSTMRLPSACALSRWRLEQVDQVLEAALGSRLDTRCRALRRCASRNSAGVMRGLRISAISACLGACASSERTTVVLPVPTSPGELDEAAGLVDAVHQVRQGLRVPLREEQVARIGRDRERLLVEAEKGRRTWLYGLAAVLMSTDAAYACERAAEYCTGFRHRATGATAAPVRVGDALRAAPAGRLFGHILRRIPRLPGPPAGRCRGAPRGCRSARGSGPRPRRAPSARCRRRLAGPARRTGPSGRRRAGGSRPRLTTARGRAAARRATRSSSSAAILAMVRESVVEGSKRFWRVKVVKSARRIFTCTQPAARFCARMRVPARSASRSTSACMRA